MARRPAPTWRTPMALLRVRSVRRGLLGGSPLWTAVAVAVWIPRLLRRLASGGTDHLTTESLRPGESVTVATRRPGRAGRVPTRRTP
ncbi:MAG: hypothetical protein ACO3C1_00210 [Ilumatobacteraceae bacterium]